MKLPIFVCTEKLENWCIIYCTKPRTKTDA